MFRFFLTICISAILLSCFLTTCFAMGHEETHIMIDDYAPYNYVEKGVAKGVSTDVLEAIYAHLGIPLRKENIEIIPWARGYMDAQHKAGSMLYSMVRIPERENLFKWVGPIVDSHIAVIALRKNNVRIHTMRDIESQLVGVVKKDIATYLLHRARVRESAMVYSNNVWNCIHKLLTNQVGVIAFDVNVVRNIIHKMGRSFDDLEIVYTLGRQPLYFAFHRRTKRAFILKMQQALDNLKRTDSSGLSTHGRILKKYQMTLME